MDKEHDGVGVQLDSPAAPDAGGHGASGDQGHGKDQVTITVDNKPVLIHRGHQAVSEIKLLGGVPAADELEQVIEGEPLKPLPDDGSVVLKGGEEFVSHPKDSGSSRAG